MNPIVAGGLASLAAGLATGIGAIPALLPLKLTQRIQGIMLGFGGGVMLAASAFSLIIPGTESAISQGYTQIEAAALMVLGVALGAIFLQLAHDLLPHEHFFKGVEGNTNYQNLKRIWLFVFAITIHNFPEGLAVGVNFATGDYKHGIPVAIGIALQNIPEGLVVAFSLLSQQYSAPYAIGISLLTGLVEPIGGVVGASVFSVAQFLLPLGMAFAAGAMLFVISDDIIPESHIEGQEKEGTLGIMVGFSLMMFLDIGLG